MKYQKAVLTLSMLALNIGQVIAAHSVTEGSIETIQVVGQNNAQVIEQTLSVGANPSPDMREQFSRLPGLNVNINGQISGILQYRGMLGERVRVNLNNAEIVGAGPNGMDPPLSHLMSVPYQQVTFYRGIAPVSVGAEVLGGAVAINDTGVDFATTSQWQSEGAVMVNNASNDVRAFSGVWHATTDTSYVGVSADHQTGDNYKAGDGREVPSTFYERQAWQIRGGMNVGAHRLDALISHRDTNEAGTPALNMDILFVDATWFRLNHTYTSNDNWQWRTVVFGNQNSHDMDNHTLRQAPPPNRYRLNQTKADVLGVDSTISLNTPEGQLDIGMNISQRSHDSYITNPNNAMFFIDNFDRVERQRMSVFVEHEQAVSFGTLRLGLRATNVALDADPIGSNMSMMNPNVASLQNSFNRSERDMAFALVGAVTHWQAPLDRRWTILASAGVKQRAPTYSELYTWFPLGISGGLADGNNYIGNLALEAETAKKLDLGVHYHGTQAEFSAHLFYDRIHDYIVGQTSTVNAANNIAMMNNTRLPLQWQNSEAILKGFELEGRYNLSEHWQILGVAEYVRGLQLGQLDPDLYRIAPLNVRMAIQYQAQQWQWRFASQWVASQDNVASLQNEMTSDGYFVLDTSLAYFVTPQMQLHFAVRNLLDENYTDHLGSVNRVMGGEISVGERVPASGRSFGVTATYQF